jgi:hypothetical protein
MSNKRKVLIVGAGGIGSWLAQHLHQLSEHGQFDGCQFLFADDDTVETKNLSYQNFTDDDILEEKAESLNIRFGFTSLVKRIATAKEITGYDCVVSAVDNAAFRKLMFETLISDPIAEDDPYWIDLRSEGTAVSFFTKHKKNTCEAMLKTLNLDNPEDGGSCQHEWELSENRIQLGNRIIATVAAQLLLNWVRGGRNSSSWSYKF